MTSSDQDTPPSQMTEAQLDELMRDWPKRTRDAARFVYLEGFNCQECGMHVDDWSFLFGLITRLQADNVLLEATINGTEQLCDKLRTENVALRAFLERFVAADDNRYVNEPVTPNEARALLGKGRIV